MVLTKRVANENLKVIQNEKFLPSLYFFLLRSRGFKCNFIDFFSRDTLALKRSGFIVHFISNVKKSNSKIGKPVVTIDHFVPMVHHSKMLFLRLRVCHEIIDADNYFKNFYNIH